RTQETVRQACQHEGAKPYHNHLAPEHVHDLAGELVHVLRRRAFRCPRELAIEHPSEGSPEEHQAQDEPAPHFFLTGHGGLSSYATGAALRVRWRFVGCGGAGWWAASSVASIAAR